MLWLRARTSAIHLMGVWIRTVSSGYLVYSPHATVHRKFSTIYRAAENACTFSLQSTLRFLWQTPRCITSTMAKKPSSRGRRVACVGCRVRVTPLTRSFTGVCEVCASVCSVRYNNQYLINRIDSARPGLCPTLCTDYGPIYRPEQQSPRARSARALSPSPLQAQPVPASLPTLFPTGGARSSPAGAPSLPSPSFPCPSPSFP